MNKRLYGQILDFNEQKRFVRLCVPRRIVTLYFPKGLFQTYMPYFHGGAYVFLQVTKEKKIIKGTKVLMVDSVEKILLPNKQHPIVYYDILRIKGQIKTLLSQAKPKLFLDLEMSMPPYKFYQGFESEIIQYGCVRLDDQNQLDLTEKEFVRPTKTPLISDRTIKFLKIEQAEIDQGIHPKTFLERLRFLFRKERPMVFVWGQNDVIELRKACKLHHMSDITSGVQIIDLLRLHKIYYGLKNDLGLFNAYRMYVGDTIGLEKQQHDALEDAMMTKDVFIGFQEVTQNK